MTSIQELRMFDCVTIKPRCSSEEEGEPEPRSGHRIVADDTNFYSVGGYNPDFWDIENQDETTYYPLFKELWQFNFASRRWKKLQATNSMPLELASHSALLVKHLLLVFGGTGVPFGDSASNNLNICDLRTMKWSVFQATGDFPIRAYGQSVHLYNNCLYVFGGTTGWEYNCDLHKLDLDTKHWSLLKAEKSAPEGRYRHEVGVYGDKFYIFGGGRSYTCYGFNILPVFDAVTETWGTVSTTSDPQVESGGFPEPRRCHTCVQLNKFVYIAGGYNGVKIFDDIWRLCLDSMRWTKLPVMLPEPVYFHSAAITPAGCMYIYGGVTQIDDTRTTAIYKVWLQIPTSLQEHCWETLTAHVSHLDQIPTERLLEIGIPAQFASRIIQPDEPSVCG